MIRVPGAFFDLPFLLAPGRVFAPRPTTELLLRAALEYLDDGPKRVADVGTGSGVIAVALAVHRPQIEVWATDTNSDAVELARENAMRNAVGDRVHVVHGALLDPVPAPVDIVVANLPYLPDSLHDARYDFDPDDAVYAPGDGMGPLRRLLDACEEKLAPGGVVLTQLRGEVLAATSWRLEGLRADLDLRFDEAA